MPTSLGEPLPPGLVLPHLDKDTPPRSVFQEPCVSQVYLGSAPKVPEDPHKDPELILASTLDPTERPLGPGMTTLPRRTEVDLLNLLGTGVPLHM